MGQDKRTNALVDMHCQTVARGMNVTVDAAMFSVEELTEMVRAAAQSGYKRSVRISNSQALGQRDKASILSAATEKKRVVFC